MDKYEYQAKLEEINTLIEKNAYDGAVKIADTIEWKRVRSVRTLCMISELYESVGRAEDSKAILYRAYRRSPNSRQILYRLTEACVQTQDFDDAVEYYTEYVNLSPNDNSKYILKYEIYKGRGSSLEEQIAVLEELKSREYTEQWAYELAKLYDEAGMREKCVAECDDIALWFHNGKYVVQALELKKKYAPLTSEQQTVYDNPSEIVDMETKEQVVEKAVPTLDEVITKELPKSEKEVLADSIIMDTEKQIAAAVQAPAAEPEPEENKISVQDISTVNLQSELASSMREILSGIRSVPSEEELESVPTITQPSAAVSDEEEQIPGQMAIDDLLTGMTVKEPAFAPEPKTFDISKKIKQEIGDTPLREYAAVQKAEAQQQEPAGKAPQPMSVPEQPEPVVMPEPPRFTAEPEPSRFTAEPKQPKFAAEPEPSRFAAEPEPSRSAAKPEQPKPAAVREEAPAEEPERGEAAEPEEATEAAYDPASYTRNGLDAKERSILGFWSRIRGMNEQIDQVVLMLMRSILANKTSSRGNVLMVGDAGNGRTTLAISLAKILSRCRGLTSVRVAKIYAEDLNKKDIAATVSKMSGGMLIIEEAGDLSDPAVSQLSMAMDFKTDSLVVVLEDERRYLQDLLARNPQFAEKFDVTVNVPMLTNDELVEFGKYYADEKDFALDQTAVDALYESIGAMQSPDQPVAILDVKEILDKAIKSASRFGVGRLTSSISGKRYDGNDKVLLKGKNFKKIK